MHVSYSYADEVANGGARVEGGEDAEDPGGGGVEGYSAGVQGAVCRACAVRGVPYDLERDVAGHEHGSLMEVGWILQEPFGGFSRLNYVLGKPSSTRPGVSPPGACSKHLAPSFSSHLHVQNVRVLNLHLAASLLIIHGQFLASGSPERVWRRFVRGEMTLSIISLIYQKP